jgi:adenine-specific DNA-methyltransferase
LIPYDILKDTSRWSLQSNLKSEIIKKMNSLPSKMKDVFKGIFQGIVTGDNNVFYLYDCQVSGGYIEGYSKATESRVKIEKDITKPILTGKTINRYNIQEKNEYLIYTYKKKENKTILLSETELENEYPLCYKYLLSLKVRLENRGSKTMNYPSWYSLWNYRNINNQNSIKILTPDVCLKSSMSFDNNGDHYYNDTSYALILESNNINDYKYYLSILNSNLTWFYLMNTGTELRGGYFRFKTKYLEPFPLPNKELYKSELISKSELMLELNTQLQEKKNKFQSRIKSNFSLEKISTKLESFYEYDFKTFVAELKKQKVTPSLKQQDEWEEYFNSYKKEINDLQAEIKKTDTEIDQMVYKLYELTDEEVKIVEGY